MKCLSIHKCRYKQYKVNTIILSTIELYNESYIIMSLIKNISLYKSVGNVHTHLLLYSTNYSLYLHCLSLALYWIRYERMNRLVYIHNVLKDVLINYYTSSVLTRNAGLLQTLKYIRIFVHVPRAMNLNELLPKLRYLVGLLPKLKYNSTYVLHTVNILLKR